MPNPYQENGGRRPDQSGAEVPTPNLRDVFLNRLQDSLKDANIVLNPNRIVLPTVMSISRRAISEITRVNDGRYVLPRVILYLDTNREPIRDPSVEISAVNETRYNSPLQLDLNNALRGFVKPHVLPPLGHDETGLHFRPVFTGRKIPLGISPNGTDEGTLLLVVKNDGREIRTAIAPLMVPVGWKALFDGARMQAIIPPTQK